MSLLYSASEWNSDTPKKRVSTIRKTVKHKPANTDDYTQESDNFQATEPMAISDTQTIMDDRASRVSDLLNKMTSVSSASDSAGDKMAEFTPLENPSMNVKKDLDNNVRSYHYTPPLLFQKPTSTASVFGGDFSPHDGHRSNVTQAPMQYSNYRMSYSDSAAAAPLVTGGVATSDTRLLEKINHMIRLLEEQQHEKTANITEEFILYTFLGVFVIFVLDSFARSGKYTR
jgi:hypothetical protein